MSTREESSSRIKDYYKELDTFLAMYKGQLTYEDIKNMPYKELCYLRDVRSERLEKERIEFERDMNKEKKAINDTMRDNPEPNDSKIILANPYTPIPR